MLWKVDTTNSDVHFTVKQMGMISISGKFDYVKGTLEYDPAAPENTEVRIKVRADSLDVPVDLHRRYLLSSSFFKAKQYSEITVNSTGVDVQDENRVNITADLTIRDVTRPVLMHIVKERETIDEFTKNPAILFKGRIRLKRGDFKLRFPAMIDWMVGEEIVLNITAQVIQMQNYEEDLPSILRRPKNFPPKSD